jgi:peptidoglycan/xylan/chitin deacetylase (PgdA/CDA1 family)
MSNTVKWPNDAHGVVMLTFDFDAETLWISRDPKNLERPSILSQGTFGPKVGLPKILELFREMEVPGTFFVPGWTAEKHTRAVASLLEAGHEVGHHGYLHKWIDVDDPGSEIEEMDRGLAALEKTVGVRPKGYRPPAAITSKQTMRLIQDRGFLYSSSMLDSINPYRHVLEDGSAGPIELPFQWNLDDSALALYSIQIPRAIFPSGHILQLWKEEFDAVYEWRALFNIVLHPQIIGRPARLAMLRQFIEYMRSFSKVWFATGTKVANAWAELNE